MIMTLERLDEVEEQVISRSFLYMHPASFRNGVEASMEAVRAVLAKVHQAGLPAEARAQTPALQGR